MCLSRPIMAAYSANQLRAWSSSMLDVKPPCLVGHQSQSDEIGRRARLRIRYKSSVFSYSPRRMCEH